MVALALAEPNGLRAGLACTALGARRSTLGVWSLRLSYNYFRRERWRVGLREDWCYAQIRRERRHFWLEQFFVVHVTQQLMLAGLTLPLWALSFDPRPPGAIDWRLGSGIWRYSRHPNYSGEQLV